MTAVGDLLIRLSTLGCRVELTERSVKIVGAVDTVPSSLMTEARRAKLAIRYALLREQAEALGSLIDGDFPLTQRKKKLPELLAVENMLAASQGALWASWRQEGFSVVWSALLEEFILVGDAPPPPGSEGMALYSWEEVQTLKDASPVQVREAHRVKKLFAGKVTA